MNSRGARSYRWLCELLTPFYVSFFLIGRGIAYLGTWPFTWLEAPLVYVDRLLSRWRGGHLFFPKTDVYPELTWGMVYFLALLIFLSVRVVSLSRFGRELLNYLLITALVALPLFTPVAEGQHLQADGVYVATDEGHLHLPLWLREAEVTVLLVSLYAYLLRFRNWPMKLLVFLLLAHFVFWSLIIVGQDWPQLGPEVYIITLLPFIASLMWALYTKSAAWVDVH